MNWDGFLMGISDFGLERLKEERQKKMQKDLLELQQKFEQDSAEFKQRLKDKADSKRVHTSRESGDGVMQGVNVFGGDVGDPWEISAEERRTRQRAEDTHADALETSAHARTSRDRQLDIQQDQVNAIRERTSAGVSGADIDVPELEPTVLNLATDLLEDLRITSNHPEWESRLQLAIDTVDEGYRKNWRREDLQRRLLGRFSAGGASGTGGTRSEGP